LSDLENNQSVCVQRTNLGSGLKPFTIFYGYPSLCQRHPFGKGWG